MSILFVTDAPGPDEQALGFPLVGVDGRLFQRMLAAAGLLIGGQPPADWRPELASLGLRGFLWARKEHRFACVLDQPLPDNITPTQRSNLIEDARPRLMAHLGEAPAIVVALGSIALEAFVGPDYKINEARGVVMRCQHIFPSTKLLPTLSPYAVRKEYRMFGPVVSDLARAKAEATDPTHILQARDVELTLEPSLSDMRLWWQRYGSTSEQLAVDIETAGNHMLTCIGFAADEKHAICVPFVDWRKPGASWWSSTAEELEAWSIVREWLNSPIPKCFHNGIYDTSWLWGLYGLPIRNWTDDTMLMHHVLYPELPKALEFLGAAYGNPPLPWKAFHRATAKREG